jgi:transposase
VVDCAMSSTPLTRKPYPSDVSDEEWSFVAPYLTLLPEYPGQRKYALREVFNGVRYIVRTGAHGRMMPHDLPPWPLVDQQMRRWMAATCFETMVQDLRVLVRRAAERAASPTAAILDSRTIPSTPESGARAGDDGHKRRKGSKVHAAVDTLGHLLALLVTPASEQDRAQGGSWRAPCRKRPGRRSNWPTSTKATPARFLLPRLPTTASNWPSSSCLRPNAASCCCRAAG